MDKFIEKLNENVDAATSFGILLTLLVSVITLYFSLKSNNSSKYIETITANRIEWIGNLRDLISEYISLIMLSPHTSSLKEEDLSKHIRNIRKCNMNIKLMLNYLGDLDKEIIGVIDNLESEIGEYYGFLSLINEHMESGLPFDESEDVILNNSYASNFLKEYLINIGIGIEDELHIYNRVNILNQKLDILKKMPMGFVNLKLSLFGQEEIIKRDIHNNIKSLTMKIQIYLKFEWNRVKYESKGRPYDKELQDYDLKRLRLSYDNPTIKFNTLFRFYIQIKAYLKYRKKFFIIALILGTIYAFHLILK